MAWFGMLPSSPPLALVPMNISGYLGVSCALSEAEVHWGSFFESLLKHGMSGVQFVVSGNHSCLKVARKAVFGWAVWQRCQFDLAQNAIHHTPSQKIRKRIGAKLCQI